MKNGTLSVLLIGISEAVSYLLQSIHEEGNYSLNMKNIPLDRQNAEKWVTKWEPDLILLEISKNFPVWEFMDEIHERENFTEVLLISKEKNFEHAYQAFQHRALNFLLEPVNKDMLLQALNELNGKIKIVNEMQRDRQKLDMYELKKHQELMEKILTNMLDKPEELETLLWEVNHRYQMELCNDHFEAIVINADKQELYLEKSGFCQKVLHIIENAFPNAHEVISAVVMPYGITGIINFSAGFTREINEGNINKLFQNLIDLQKEYGAFDLAIGVGNIVHSMKEINYSLQEAFRAEQYKLVDPDKKIFYASDIPKKIEGIDNVVMEAQKKNLARFLRGLDVQGLEGWFQDVIGKVEKVFEDYPEGYGLLRDLILAMAREAWKDKNSEIYFEEEDFTIRRLNNFFQGKKMLELLKNLIVSICKRIKENQNTKITKPIQVALDYINQHYKEPVSLEELADISGLSPNYFSAMFKEQIGDTYIDYLTEIRLENAKQLLINTNKTVKDIANEIGYLDDKYFRKLFKNRFGITPSEYRKK